MEASLRQRLLSLLARGVLERTHDEVGGVLGIAILLELVHPNASLDVQTSATLGIRQRFASLVERDEGNVVGLSIARVDCQSQPSDRLAICGWTNFGVANDIAHKFYAVK
jgi:hypothetical protein